jgi:D-alanine transaminase/branched-chain amino acid aminotransferase
MDYPIWINGAWKPAHDAYVPVQDIGFLRGYGIFDFFRIMDGKPIFLADHLARFERSAAKMGLLLPYSTDVLAACIYELAAMSEDACLGVKMVLTGGESLNGYIPAEQPNLWILPSVFQFTDPEKGMRLLSKEFVREMADIKSLNYAFGIRHIPEMKAAGADDLIYYTEKHGVSESTRSNLFYVKNGEVFTPDTHILEGITRMKVLEIARADHPVHVQRCTLDDFLSADEVFTTGSTKRVVPILSIDGKKIGSGERGPLARDLYDELVKLE